MVAHKLQNFHSDRGPWTSKLTLWKPPETPQKLLKKNQKLFFEETPQKKRQAIFKPPMEELFGTVLGDQKWGARVGGVHKTASQLRRCLGSDFGQCNQFRNTVGTTPGACHLGSHLYID